MHWRCLVLLYGCLVLCTHALALQDSNVVLGPSLLEEHALAAGEEAATLETHIAVPKVDSDGEETTQWDSEDGGTAVVLSNDNSVSQTWDDREGRKIMAEAANKRVEEQKEKAAHERGHKRRVAEQNKKDEKRHQSKRAKREDAHKQEQKKVLEKSKKELEAKRKQNKEDLEQQKKTQEAELKLTESEGRKKLEHQKRTHNAEEQRSKFLSVRGAQHFRPKRGHIIARGSQIPSSSSWTYLFWIKPLGVQRSWANIIHKGQANINRNPAVWFFPKSTRLHIRSGIGRAWNTGANTGADPAQVLPVGQWYHVAISHTDGALRVFYNGQQKGFYRSPRPPLGNNGPLYGSDPWHVAANCIVADMRIYKRVLSPSEIAIVVKEKKH